MPEEIVYPKKGRADPDIGPVALMVAMDRDVALVRKLMGAKGRCAGRVLTSKLYKATHGDRDMSIVGPVLGAPHGVMILEKLRVLGAREFLFFGWCGSLQQRVKTGDVLVPDRGVIGEGTSQYYLSGEERPKPSRRIRAAIEETLAAHAIPFERGPVWSTDAPYRETRERILSLQKEGVLGVDMELSALLTASRFRQVELAALLVVSDELGALRWRPGFTSHRLTKTRKAAAEALCATCLRMGDAG